MFFRLDLTFHFYLVQIIDLRIAYLSHAMQLRSFCVTKNTFVSISKQSSKWLYNDELLQAIIGTYRFHTNQLCFLYLLIVLCEINLFLHANDTIVRSRCDVTQDF